MSTSLLTPAEVVKGVKNPVLIGTARLAERFQYWAADRTVVLSHGFKDTLVGKGVPAEKVAIIPVWLDPDEIRPMSRDNAWRREQGISTETFVVLYVGTIGEVSGARMVVDAANEIRDDARILFVFNGDGAERPAVERRVAELGLKNVRFFPFQPRERLSEVQATADVGLVTLAPGRGRTSVPSKILGYMAAARPCLASVDPGSDTAREVSENGAGVVVPPGDPGALAAAIRELLAQPDRRRAMGEAGRRRLEAHYAKERVLAMYERVLEEVCSDR